MNKKIFQLISSQECGREINKKLLLSDREYGDFVCLLSKYFSYLSMIKQADKWVDNGLRAGDGIRGMDNRTKGRMLENSLGKALKDIVQEYGLQVPFEEYWIADGVVILNNGTFMRIEA